MSNDLTKKESVPIFQKFKKSRFFKKVELVIWGVLLLGCLEVASSAPLFTLFTPAYFQLYCVPKPQAWFKLQCFLQACRITLTAKQMSLKNWKIKLAFDGSFARGFLATNHGIFREFWCHSHCGKIGNFIQKLGSSYSKIFQLTVLASKLYFRDLKLKID